MRRTYDPQNGRLVYSGRKASPSFWDGHWRGSKVRSAAKAAQNDRFILENTRRFLTKGRVLEGGCGPASKLYCLHRHGYEAYGVDYAEETVRRVNEELPELKVSRGDVRSLDFGDGFFDAYWSLGVIEHFPGGFGAVLREMRRVLRAGGVAFVSFPYMSPLRRLKARLGAYDAGSDGGRDFYQFALDAGRVCGEFSEAGFILQRCRPYDGIKGFKDEVPVFQPALQRLYDYRGRSAALERARRLLDIILRGFASHMMLMVFRKEP